MKIETSKLTGALLDYWVAQAEGLEVVLWANEGPQEEAACVLKERRPNAYPTFFQPSVSWAQGGPIIEREMINLECPRGLTWHANVWMQTPAPGYAPGTKFAVASSDTPLIAAMRCYVASKLGFEIDIPDELIQK